MATPFWLSHHRAEHYGRCLRIGSWHVCARCLGLYPLILILLAAQIALRAPRAFRLDPWIALGLAAPALLDWARGRLWPASGSNATRVLTGALLAVALARTLYLHLRDPWPALLLVQVGAFAAVAVAVEAWVFWRTRA